MVTNGPNASWPSSRGGAPVMAHAAPAPLPGDGHGLQRAAAPGPTEGGGARPRVLVVDDDAALAEMLGIVLRREGFEPVFVATGDRAMDAFRRTRPDVVLLDLMLPGRDGLDVCRDLRAESGVPIVMLTARAEAADLVRGLHAGP